MRVGTVSLNYYKQNSVAAATSAGQRTEHQKLDFVAFTEARTAKMDKGLIKGLAPSMAYVDGGESPQAYNKNRWVLEGHFTRQLTDGVDKITPNLFAVVGVYHSKKNPRKRVAFISTHLVPLTLGGKPRSNYSQRWAMWKAHWNGIKLLVKDLKAQGCTVIVAGDFNHLHAPKNIIKQIDPKAKWVFQRGLDWAFVIEGRTKVRSFGRTTTSFFSGSDHKGETRTVFFR